MRRGRGAATISLVLFFAQPVVLTWGHEPGSGHERLLSRRELKHPVADFTLTGHDGRQFQFQSLRGKVVLLAFAYTTCPDVCPLITAAMRSVQNSLTPGSRAGVFFVTITTDPEIDSPAVLASYARRQSVDLSNWVFLTGDPATLARVWKNFGVKVERKARGLIDHTPLTVLIDAKGMLRIAYYGTAPDARVVAADLRSLLEDR